MNQSLKQQKLTIPKEHFITLSVLLTLAAALGYAYGNNQGYHKGIQEAGYQPINTLTLANP